MVYLGMNTTRPPFNDMRVRQAVAHVLPYDKMFDNALYGRAAKLYAAAARSRPSPGAGHRLPDRRRQGQALLAEAGLAAASRRR